MRNRRSVSELSKLVWSFRCVMFQLAAELVGFMQQFLNVFAELKGRKFHLAGESVRSLCSDINFSPIFFFSMLGCISQVGFLNRRAKSVHIIGSRILQTMFSHPALLDLKFKRCGFDLVCLSDILFVAPSRADDKHSWTCRGCRYEPGTRSKFCTQKSERVSFQVVPICFESAYRRLTSCLCQPIFSRTNRPNCE